MEEDFLKRFLSAVDQGVSPDNETLKQIASALRRMEEGESFKAAFERTKKRGRIKIKPIEEYFVDSMEAQRITNMAAEYAALKKQFKTKGRKATEAKHEICKKYAISDREFDKLKALGDFLIAEDEREKRLDDFIRKAGGTEGLLKRLNV